MRTDAASPALPKQSVIFGNKDKDHEEEGQSYHPDYGDRLACLLGLLVVSVPETALDIGARGVRLLAEASVHMPELFFQGFLLRVLISRLVIENPMFLRTEKSKTELHI